MTDRYQKEMDEIDRALAIGNEKPKAQGQRPSGQRKYRPKTERGRNLQDTINKRHKKMMDY